MNNHLSISLLAFLITVYKLDIAAGQFGGWFGGGNAGTWNRRGSTGWGSSMGRSSLNRFRGSDDSDDDDDDSGRSWNRQASTSWRNDDNDGQRASRNQWGTNSWRNRDDDDDNRPSWNRRGSNIWRRDSDSDDEDDNRPSWNRRGTNTWRRHNSDDDDNMRSWNRRGTGNLWGRRDDDDDDDRRTHVWPQHNTRAHNTWTGHRPVAHGHRANTVQRQQPVVSRRNPVTTWQQRRTNSNIWSPTAAPSRHTTISRPQNNNPGWGQNNNQGWGQNNNPGWGQNPLMAAWAMNEMF